MIKGYLTQKEYKEVRRRYNKLQPLLEEIAKSDQPIAEIDWEKGYSNLHIAYCAFYKAVKSSKYPYKVRTSKGRLFIIKNE